MLGCSGHPPPSERVWIILGCVWVLSVGAVAREPITFSQDFDSGSLDVAATTVDYSSPGSPVITLAARDTGTWHHPRLYSRLTGVEGLIPMFQITPTNHQPGHRHIFSYDQQNWVFFDNISEGSPWDTFNHDTPFAQDTVYISHALPYPVSRTDALVASLKSNPWVSPTASADANLVVGRTLGTAGGGYYDDKGRIVPAQNLYGFKVTDPMGAASRTKIVWNSGNHADELTGTMALEGSISFLVSDDPRAIALRRRTELYVYPQSNPEGRYSGYHRDCPEAYGKDHNREWDQPGPFTDITTYENAMKADTGGDVDYFFDYHTSGAAYRMPAIWGIASHLAGEYVAALKVREPDLLTTVWNKVGSAQDWGMDTVNGLSAEYSLTPEIGIVDGAMEGAYLEAGANYALALYDVLAPEANLGLGDMNGSGSVDGADIPAFYLGLLDLAAYWGSYQLSPEVMGDVNGDGVFDNDDVAPFMVMAGVTHGDADLDGDVDDDDLSRLLANWGLQTEWTHGEFSGPAPVDDDDLSLLLANWTGTIYPPGGEGVPEPATMGLLVLGGAGLFFRGRRGAHSR